MTHIFTIVRHIIVMVVHLVTKFELLEVKVNAMANEVEQINAIKAELDAYKQSLDQFKTDNQAAFQKVEDELAALEASGVNVADLNAAIAGAKASADALPVLSVPTVPVGV